MIREDWIYLLGLLLPLVFYNVTLKVIRIFTQLSPPGILGFLDQVRSDIFFNLGYALLWIGVFAVFRRGFTRWISLFLFHVSAVVAVILTTGTHFFYKTTGSTLDYSFIMLSLSSFSETWRIISAETSALHWLLLVSVLSYLLAGPTILTRILARRWRLPVWTPGRPWKASLVVWRGGGRPGLSLGVAERHRRQRHVLPGRPGKHSPLGAQQTGFRAGNRDGPRRRHATHGRLPGTNPRNRPAQRRDGVSGVDPRALDDALQQRPGDHAVHG